MRGTWEERGGAREDRERKVAGTRETTREEQEGGTRRNKGGTRMEREGWEVYLVTVSKFTTPILAMKALWAHGVRMSESTSEVSAIFLISTFRVGIETNFVATEAPE
jgi:hypothetical protein